MLFTPAQNEYGTPYVDIKFVGSDGQYNSSEATGALNINHIDQPPVAVPGQIALLENAVGSQFTFNYSDVDSPAASMSVTIVSLPSSTLGALQTTGGVALDVGNIISYPIDAVFVPAMYQYGTTSFSFRVQDATSPSANTESVSITITHVNHAPTAYWTGLAQADENTILTTSQIQVSDPDEGDVLSVFITEIPPSVKGTLQQFDGAPCVAPCLVTDAQYRMQFVPVIYGYGNPFASIKFLASDGKLNSSEITGTLAINFVDQAPVSLPSIVQLLENGPSTQFNITYFDIDSPLTDMSATILSLPSGMGTLQTTGGTPISVGDVVPSPLIIMFTPAQYTYGIATFSFQVKDATLYSNTTELITLNVTHVNHAPLAFWSGNALADEDTIMVITQLRASDPDTGDVVSSCSPHPIFYILYLKKSFF
jgi:hypothetical protein